MSVCQKTRKGYRSFRFKKIQQLNVITDSQLEPEIGGEIDEGLGQLKKPGIKVISPIIITYKEEERFLTSGESWQVPL